MIKFTCDKRESQGEYKCTKKDSSIMNEWVRVDSLVSYSLFGLFSRFSLSLFDFGLGGQERAHASLRETERFVHKLALTLVDRGLPAVVFDQMSQLDYKLALFVLLTTFKRLLILPAHGGLARVAIDVGDRVQAGEQVALFGRPTCHIHHLVEQVRSTLAALKRFRYQIVVVGQMCSTMHAQISAFIFWQVNLECFHSHLFYYYE